MEKEFLVTISKDGKEHMFFAKAISWKKVQTYVELNGGEIISIVDYDKVLHKYVRTYKIRIR